jgi:type VI secretion system secreted protein VgrG
VQYRESDWAFVCRLMEEEGIFYFFEHGEQESKLVIADDKSAHTPIAGNSTVTYRPRTGALGAVEETVTRLWFGEEVRSGKVTIRDYNFKTPDLSLEGSSAAKIDGDLELYDYSAKFDDPDAGKARAKLWLQAEQATRRSGDGDSTCLRFMPGQIFTLGDTAENDVRDDLNIDYLLTRIEHHGAEPQAQAATQEAEPYRNRFWVIPAEVPFRATHETPRPRVYGIQTAVVVGPAGEEIHTDEHGRIKVQFHWDRLGQRDDKSSCWVRVQQPWSGPGWGHLFIPRMGQEVVVEFLEGDPDRPLVTGAVYHAKNVPPYKLPDHKTVSTVKSSSSIGGDGSNELRFEDQKGSEEIFIHAEKDWVIVVENDKAQLIRHDETSKVEHDRKREVGNDETLRVGHNRAKTVGDDETVAIGQNQAVTIGANHVEGVGGDESVAIGVHQTLSVGKNRSVDVGGNHSEGVGGDQTSAVAGQWTKNVTKEMTLTVDKDRTETIKGSANLSVEKSRDTKIKEKDSENVGKEKTIIVGDKIHIECGEAKVTIEKNGNILITGKDIGVEGKGPITVKGNRLSIESKGTVNLKASGDIKVKGSKIGMN